MVEKGGQKRMGPIREGLCAISWTWGPALHTMDNHSRFSAGQDTQECEVKSFMSS